LDILVYFIPNLSLTHNKGHLKLILTNKKRNYDYERQSSLVNHGQREQNTLSRWSRTSDYSDTKYVRKNSFPIRSSVEQHYQAKILGQVHVVCH